MIFPPYLSEGDHVAIVSPASAVNPDYIDGACRMLSQWGYVPVPSAYCKGRTGYYSGDIGERLHDFKEALLNPEIKAILCARGGYGTIHLVESLSVEVVRQNPKWLIGFSDISVLHALYNNAGVASVHASMAKHMTKHDVSDYCNRALCDILRGKMPRYEIAPHEYNKYGEVRGEIVGGNLAVLAGLIGTEIDLFKSEKILFIEDIGEPIYKVERLLYQLRLSGVLSRLKGLIVGRFTGYDEPNASGETMYGMISNMVKPYSYPVAFNFPIGHTEENFPIVEGGQAKLTVTTDSVELSFL